jgi:O-antigen/teichoic acid export membrane protein
MVSFLRNLFYTTSTQIVVFISTLIFNILVARILGPSNQGVYALLLLIPIIAARFGHLGMDASNAFYAQSKDYSEADIISNSLILTAIMACLGGLITVIYVSLFHIAFTQIHCILLILTVSFLLKTLIQSFLMGRNEIKKHSTLLIADSLMQLCIILILIYTIGITPKIVLAVAVLSSVLNILICFRYIKFPAIRFHTDLFRNGLKYGSKSWINNLANTLIYRVDIFIIAYFLTSSEVGYYAIAVLLVEKIWFFNAAIGNALFPSVLKMGVKEGAALTAKIVRVNLLIALIGIAILFAIAKPLTQVLFGASYGPSFLPLVWLLPGVLFLSVPKILVWHFGAMNKMEFAYTSSITALIINVILNLILIPAHGIAGAAIATSISYLIYAIVNIHYYIKLTGISKTELMVVRIEDVKQVWNKCMNLKKTTPQI